MISIINKLDVIDDIKTAIMLRTRCVLCNIASILRYHVCCNHFDKWVADYNANSEVIVSPPNGRWNALGIPLGVIPFVKFMATYFDLKLKVKRFNVLGSVCLMIEEEDFHAPLEYVLVALRNLLVDLLGVNPYFIAVIDVDMNGGLPLINYFSYYDNQNIVSLIPR